MKRIGDTIWVVFTAIMCSLAVRKYRRQRRLYQQQQAVAHGKGWFSTIAIVRTSK